MRKEPLQCFYCIIYIAVRFSIAHLATIWYFMVCAAVYTNKPRQNRRPHATPLWIDQSPAPDPRSSWVQKVKICLYFQCCLVYSGAIKALSCSFLLVLGLHPSNAGYRLAKGAQLCYVVHPTATEVVEIFHEGKDFGA